MLRNVLQEQIYSVPVTLKKILEPLLSAMYLYNVPILSTSFNKLVLGIPVSLFYLHYSFINVDHAKR
jgi:hypothetical protein